MSLVNDGVDGLCIITVAKRANNADPSSSATYDLEAIHTIVNTTPVVHVSFQSNDPAEGPFPATLPMIGQMGSFDHPSSGLEDPLDCYLHGYVSARMMKNAQAGAQGEGSQGLPMSIAATKVDGLVLSLT